jgi:hypothetical protein
MILHTSQFLPYKTEIKRFVKGLRNCNVTLSSSSLNESSSYQFQCMRMAANNRAQIIIKWTTSTWAWPAKLFLVMPHISVDKSVKVIPRGALHQHRNIEEFRRI